MTDSPHDAHGHGHGPPPGEEPGFFDKPGNVRILMWSLYAICAVLVVADFVVHRHIYLSIEEIPAFYPIYGFASIVLLVMVAKGMRKVLMRDEDYYDAR